MVDITCVVDARAELGESTLWDPAAGALWWIDILSNRIHRHTPATGENTTWDTPEAPGCLGLRAKGGLVLTMANGFHFFDPDTGRFEAIADPERHLPETRFNDGKVDRQGRFWSGTMFDVPGRPAEYAGALYRMDADLSIHRMIEGVACANGLAWSPDSRTMYFADSHRRQVDAYDVDPATGNIENRRTFIDLTGSDGVPDGATVDAQGCYWLTLAFAGTVCRYDPDGQLMQTIMLPTDIPTCCEFGGKALDILYVTTAVLKRPAQDLTGQQHPGGVFAIDVGVKGLALPAFAG